MKAKQLIENAKNRHWVLWLHDRVYARLALDSCGRVISVSPDGFFLVALRGMYACRVVKKKEALAAGQELHLEN